MDSINEIKLNDFKPTANIIKQYYNNRQIVLYGDSLPLRKLLERDYNIKNILIATGIRANVGKNGLIDINSLKGLSSKYYIVAPFLETSSKKRLISLGYSEFKDFVFTLHDPISIQPSSGDYHDEYGNNIHCNSCKISLRGDVGNTNIFVDDSVYFSNNCSINIFGSNCNITIKKGCWFGHNFEISLFSDAKLEIDESSTFGNSNEFIIYHGEKVMVGKNSMFSNEIKLYAGDGHAIFSIDTAERTNLPSTDKTKYTVELKDHVWVGLRATILGTKNTVIGKSSIIGACAVVTDSFPNNCAVAGNPAKIVSKNLTWGRSILETNIQNCGEEYIGLTEI